MAFNNVDINILISYCTVFALSISDGQKKKTDHTKRNADAILSLSVLEIPAFSATRFH